MIVPPFEEGPSPISKPLQGRTLQVSGRRCPVSGRRGTPWRARTMAGEARFSGEFPWAFGPPEGMRIRLPSSHTGTPWRARTMSSGADFEGRRCSPKQASGSQDREVGIPGAGKKGICRKDVRNRGNELKDLLKTKDVRLCSVQKRTENELVFACKNEQINAIWDQLWREKRGWHRKRRVPALNKFLNTNSEVARLSGTKPLIWIATLATLSPRERAEINHRRRPSPLGRGLMCRNGKTRHFRCVPARHRKGRA